MFQMPQLSAVK